ncbi:MAG TPA: hypothetical protein VFN22_07265 [Gemmatimonadales bacterium]|nr:hypothetical protein [Gemmatimonadales bacterium]
MHIEFLEDNRLTLSAVHDGKTWFQATGTRDTTWRAEAKAPDGTGFAWSIAYDLDVKTTGPCFVVVDIQIPSRAAPVPATLQVGFGSEARAPFVRAQFLCADVVYGLLDGVDQMKGAVVEFVEGEMTLDVGEWPALVGRFDAHIALHTYLSL